MRSQTRRLAGHTPFAASLLVAVDSNPELASFIAAHDDHIHNFVRRVLQDAFTAASPAHWQRRSVALRDALPRPGDYPGRATYRERALRTASTLCSIYAAECAAIVRSDGHVTQLDDETLALFADRATWVDRELDRLLAMPGWSQTERTLLDWGVRRLVGHPRPVERRRAA